MRENLLIAFVTGMIADLDDLRFSESREPVFLASRRATMPITVSKVVLMRAVGEVPQHVIVWIAIKVSADLTRWARAFECVQHK
jgi:hypothetical protein